MGDAVILVLKALDSSSSSVQTRPLLGLFHIALQVLLLGHSHPLFQNIRLAGKASDNASASWWSTLDNLPSSSPIGSSAGVSHCHCSLPILKATSTVFSDLSASDFREWVCALLRKKCFVHNRGLCLLDLRRQYTFLFN